MNASELEQLVLDFVNRPNYRPVKPRTIAKELRLPKESSPDLKKAVKQLVKQGRLGYGSNHLVLRPSARSSGNQLTGIFHRTKSGFGFVRPTGSGYSRQDDVYIPSRKARDASTGDLVRVRLQRKAPPGTRARGRERPPPGGSDRQVGEVLEVIERENHQFVGSYFEQDATGMVRVDGKLFAQPIYVGDAGAKNAQPGDMVVIEMVRFPSHVHFGEGVITEVLGDRAAPGVDTLLILREYDLPDEFPEDVFDDARNQAAKFDGSVGDGRVDLTDLTVVTIDPKDARDFDDAISLEKLDNGHWRLGVHIADVAHFVPAKSALDREARERATSVYLPDRVIPMLPETISNNLASLQPNRVRYTRTAFIEFTSDGVRVATETCKSAIKSKRRFSYEQVDDYLANRRQWETKLTKKVDQLLGWMYELAMILRQRRMDRGAIELSMPEIKLELDRHGKVTGAFRVEYTESHQIIEEFMLAANEAVAERLQDLGLAFLRRIHESPDPRKLKALTQFVRQLDMNVESLESRFEIKRVLAEVADRPECHAVNYAVLRSMQKAVYSPQEIGHYALASSCYCHFTSPIRRYPDLTVHRLLDRLEDKKKAQRDFDVLVALGEHCSEREQRAEGAERDLTKLKLLSYLSTRIGQQMDVVITGVESYGLFAQGVELPAEGLLHVNAMAEDRYDHDPTTQTLTGRRAGNAFRLGDLIRVEIARVDLEARELDFRLVAGPRPHASRNVSNSIDSGSASADGNSAPKARSRSKTKAKAAKSKKPKTKKPKSKKSESKKSKPKKPQARKSKTKRARKVGRR